VAIKLTQSEQDQTYLGRKKMKHLTLLETINQEEHEAFKHKLKGIIEKSK